MFNYPANYWVGASAVINHILSLNNGNIKGKKIALVYHNSAYGKEPIRTLQELEKKHGFKLSLLPVDHPGQEQKSQWLQIRREKPDYVTMWGWGVMNPTAIQEAANIRYPMENFIGGGGQDLKVMFCLLVMLLTAISRWPCITQVQTSRFMRPEKACL